MLDRLYGGYASCGHGAPFRLLGLTSLLAAFAAVRRLARANISASSIPPGLFCVVAPDSDMVILYAGYFWPAAGSLSSESRRSLPVVVGCWLVGWTARIAGRSVCFISGDSVGLGVRSDCRVLVVFRW